MKRKPITYVSLLVLLVLFSSNLICSAEGLETIRLTEPQAKETAKNITSSYRKHLLTLAKDFKEQYTNYYSKKEDLEELFNIVAKDFLKVTKIFRWEEARLLSLEESSDYIMNDKENTPKGVAERMKLGEDKIQTIFKELRNGKSKEPIVQKVDEYYIVALKLFEDEELGEKSDLVEKGCVNCHKLFKENENVDLQHLKGALVFKIPSSEG